MLAKRRSIRVLDPSFFSTVEVTAGAALAYFDLMGSSERSDLDRLYRERLAGFLTEFDGLDAAHVVGTGPSMAAAMGDGPATGLRIACNTIVASPADLERIDPHVICFADPAFHFGPSEYADQFRSDLVRVVREREPYLIFPAQGGPLVERYLPGYQRSIGIRLRTARRFNIPHPGAQWVKRCGNVLTNLMLPTAVAAKASRVVVYGCDGRDPADDGFWQHAAQYDAETYQSVREIHPAFFDDRDYLRYYLKHTETLAAQIRWVEEAGVRVTSAQRSLIPALAERYAPE
ncbi:MAG: hypothetical protein AAGA37_07985 [Actinomycetota bacterium]